MFIEEKDRMKSEYMVYKEKDGFSIRKRVEHDGFVAKHSIILEADTYYDLMMEVSKMTNMLRKGDVVDA